MPGYGNWASVLMLPNMVNMAVDTGTHPCYCCVHSSSIDTYTRNVTIVNKDELIGIMALHHVCEWAGYCVTECDGNIMERT